MSIGFISYLAFIALIIFDGHKTLNLIVQSIFYTCLMASGWLNKRGMFEKLREPAGKWFVPWNVVKFSVSPNGRVFVRDIGSVEPWYVEKLGLRQVIENPPLESDVRKYKFNADGRAITLTSKALTASDKTPILLTKKIERMKKILLKRGIEAGEIKQDRQGIRYFEIHDPESNVIEVVEE